MHKTISEHLWLFALKCILDVSLDLYDIDLGNCIEISVECSHFFLFAWNSIQHVLYFEHTDYLGFLQDLVFSTGVTSWVYIFIT